MYKVYNSSSYPSDPRNFLELYNSSNPTLILLAFGSMMICPEELLSLKLIMASTLVLLNIKVGTQMVFFCCNVIEVGLVFLKLMNVSLGSIHATPTFILISIVDFISFNSKTDSRVTLTFSFVFDSPEGFRYFI